MNASELNEKRVVNCGKRGIKALVDKGPNTLDRNIK